jgi:hypothetical protein
VIAESLVPFSSLGYGYAAPLGDSGRAVKHSIVLEFVMPSSILTADADSICLHSMMYQAMGLPWVL